MRLRKGAPYLTASSSFPLELETVRLTDEERVALAKACPYFSDKYLDYLASIRLNPREQVQLTFVPKEGEDMGEIACVIHGLWRDCILYEVPIMSISKPAPWFLLTRADDK